MNGFISLRSELHKIKLTMFNINKRALTIKIKQLFVCIIHKKRIDFWSLYYESKRSGQNLVNRIKLLLNYF